jgi:hypothetical protein
MVTNTADAGYSISKRSTPPTAAYLSEQMTVAGLTEALAALPFDAHQESKIVLDPGVRDYLLRAALAVGGDPGAKVRHAWRLIRPPRG